MKKKDKRTRKKQVQSVERESPKRSAGVDLKSNKQSSCRLQTTRREKKPHMHVTHLLNSLSLSLSDEVEKGNHLLIHLKAPTTTKK